MSEEITREVVATLLNTLDEIETGGDRIAWMTKFLREFRRPAPGNEGCIICGEEPIGIGLYRTVCKVCLNKATTAPGNESELRKALEAAAITQMKIDEAYWKPKVEAIEEQLALEAQCKHWALTRAERAERGVALLSGHIKARNERDLAERKAPTLSAEVVEALAWADCQKIAPGATVDYADRLVIILAAEVRRLTGEKR